MRVVAYCRVSTQDQAIGLSLAGQQEAIRRECEAREWELCFTGSDAASGKTMKNRPGLAAILAALDQGRYDVLAIARLDRLSRSAADFYDLMDHAQKHGWQVLCLSPRVDMTDPFGRAMAGVAAVFSQLERELISQRQRESVAARRAAGTYVCPQPHSREADARAAVLRGTTDLTYEEIGARLIAEGYPPPRAQFYDKGTVRRMVLRATR